MILDDIEQGFDGAVQRGMIQAQGAEALGREVAGDAAGDERVHHEAMAEQLARAPLPVFAQTGALDMGEGETDIVTDGADVAQMVGDTLALGHERTQTQGARRHQASGGALDGLTGGPGMGDRGVAGDPPGEADQAGRIAADGELFDALVNVAQPFLQTQHLLAHRLEAEVSRLDDARMDGADRDLEDAGALNPHEGVIDVGGGAPGRLAAQRKVAAQRKTIGRPSLMAGPATLVRLVLRRVEGVIREADADQVMGMTFQPIQAGIGGRLGGQQRPTQRDLGLDHQIITRLLQTGADADLGILRPRFGLVGIRRIGPEPRVTHAHRQRHPGRGRPVLGIQHQTMGRRQDARIATMRDHMLVLQTGQILGQPVEAAAPSDGSVGACLRATSGRAGGIRWMTVARNAGSYRLIGS